MKGSKKEKLLAAGNLIAQEREITELLRNVPTAAVGARLHRARKRQGWSIRELAEVANVNKNSIVRLEKGGMPHPLTVLKLCAAMGIHLASIIDPRLDEAKIYSIHRHGDDLWYDLNDYGSGPLAEVPTSVEERKGFAENGIPVPMLMLQSRLEAGHLMPSVLEIFDESTVRSHIGEEFLYVLEGSIRLTIGNEVVELSQGESITFWSSEQHVYAPAPGTKLPVRVLCVILHNSQDKGRFDN